jgi:hypothetical protein
MWHESGNDSSTHYRVVHRVVQKVRLEKHESAAMLKLLDPPFQVPSLLLKEGFRDGLHIIVDDDHFMLAGIALPCFEGWEELRDAAAGMHVKIRHAGGNLLSCDVLIAEWSQDAMMEALTVARALPEAAAGLRASDAPAGNSSAGRSLRSALLSTRAALEALKPKRAKK